MSISRSSAGNAVLTSSFSSLLPLLASHAAIELDNVILGNGNNLTSVRNLAEVLGSTSGRETRGSGSKALANPGAEVIITGAFGSCQRGNGTKIKTIEQLETELNKIADMLLQITPESDTQDLEAVREFCSSLTLSAASYACSISGASLD